MTYTYEIEVQTSDIGEGYYGNLTETELNNFINSNPNTSNQSITFERGLDVDGITTFTIHIQYDNN